MPANSASAVVWARAYERFGRQQEARFVVLGVVLSQLHGFAGLLQVRVLTVRRSMWPEGVTLRSLRDPLFYWPNY